MDVEARLSAIRADVAEVLAVEPDRSLDEVPLLELGADSLCMVEIAARLREAHGVEVTPETLFEARTIKDLARLADRGGR
ncbi:acyl carrier protein [Saccharothrix xinjiangensis]|uniref:Acyl carrier protein n=1 Tax=Saccharothrix xinjiangensis TaxID=204798 RepID=A0ABV9XQV6_9PSEU